MVDDSFLFMLLLLFLVVVANFFTSIDLVVKSNEEPTADSFKDGNHARLEYIYSHRELIKLAILQLRTFVLGGVNFIIAYLLYYNTDITNFGIIPLIIVSIFISAVIHILFSNILPLLTFDKYRKGVSGKYYYYIKMIMYLFYLSSRIIISIRNKSYSDQVSDKPISMEELSDAVEIVSKVNTMEEKRILSGMVRFANANVEDIICHRTEMVTIDYSATFAELKALFNESGFSRIPVYKGSNDNIIGVIHLKEILAFIEVSDYRWQERIHKIIFVKGDKPINELLLLFQAKKEHMAMVVEEYGSILGLVTLEDVLEEIVGEINDEFDEEDTGCKEMSDGVYIVEGKTAISEFIDILDLDEDILEIIPEEIDTVAGLIVDLLRDFPKIGSTVTFLDKYQLIVVSTDRHRIDRVRVEIIKEEEESNDDKKNR